MTGDKMINDNLRPIATQMLPDTIFYMNIDKFFGRRPIDLEFYEFSGYRLTGSQDENITMYTNMDSLYGHTPNNLKIFQFDIAIVYYNVFDDDEYIVYFAPTRLTLNVTDNLDVEELSQVPTCPFPKPFSFVWKLFIIILAL